MGLINFPPAVRLEMWSKCIIDFRNVHPVSPHRMISAHLGSRNVQLATLRRSYTTVHASKNEKVVHPPPEHDTNPNSLGWDGMAESLMQHPKLSAKRRRVLLTNLRSRTKGRPDSLVLETFRRAISSDDPFPGLFTMLRQTPMENNLQQELKSLSKKKQYVRLPERLFEITHTARDFYTMCQDLLKLPLSLEEDIKTLDGLTQTHSLTLHIPGIVSEETTIGMSNGGRIARNEAWAAMLIRLDATGALQELANKAGSDQAIELGDVQEDVVPEDVIKQEKEAGIDVYNYAAKFGLVAQFDINVRPGRVRGGGQSKRPKVQVSIKLPEQNIDVAAHGTTVRGAVILASLAFKRAAEKFRTQHDQAPSFGSSSFKALSTHTAGEFIKFYQKSTKQTLSEFECKEYFSGYWSQLMLDGEPVGHRVWMPRRKDADNVACLTAAIDIAGKETDLLDKFAKEWLPGKSMETYPPIRTAFNSEALEVMRTTLANVSEVGLSDDHETLPAVETSVRNRTVRRPRAPSAEVSERLLERLQQFEKDPATADLRNSRKSLPMTHYSSRVLELVSGNMFSIIVGATGSGKTTQVPQIILEDAIRRGEGARCDIICTQPRRIAASSVAQRVAVERGEKLMESVGYQVRGDSKLPKLGGSINYSTTGILLERLKWDSDNVMDNTSHLVIDEVHERDMTVDFLLIVLKKAIKARQLAGKSVPRVVLMSATMDTKLFSEYLPNEFNGKLVPCPSLDVPGRTFPVKETYLEDIVGEIRRANTEEFLGLATRDKDTNNYLAAERAFAIAANGNGSAPTGIDWKREEDQVGPPNDEKEEGLVPVALLVATIAHVCKTSTDGAILAFLPGLQEIILAEELMKADPVFGVDFADGGSFKVHQLHSTVPAEKQREIFEPIPPGCRRIILSTNIAETSVTVPDVKHVIDLGKLRETDYDHTQRITALKTKWESGSNARQRAGRAGRVSNGNYYALYSHERRKAMAPAALPELLRTDLQTTGLSVKAQSFEGSVSEFLSAAIEPPPADAVQFAVENLKDIEAFTDYEELTHLGDVLSRLPVHPTLGKMIILGLIFRCLDPMIIIASTNNERPLFFAPLEERKQGRKSKKDFSVANSDHIGALRAFQELRSYSSKNGPRATLAHAKSLYLHFGAFRSILQVTKLIEQALINVGFFDGKEKRSSTIGGEALNRNSNNMDLIKCLLVAGLYPNIGVRGTHVGGRMHRVGNNTMVQMHPQSVNKIAGRPEKPKQDQVYAFTTLARSVDGTLFMRESSLVSPLAALLFGGRLEAKMRARELVMDEWLPFKIVCDNPLVRRVGEGAGGELKVIIEFLEAKERMLNGVFKSLSGLNKESLADDPVREMFVDGLVMLLEANADTETIQEQITKEDAWAAIAKMIDRDALARRR